MKAIAILIWSLVGITALIVCVLFAVPYLIFEALRQIVKKDDDDIFK